MRASRLAVPAASAILVVASLALPGVRARIGLIQHKIAGETRSPWSEVGIQMAPWSLQPLVRQWVGARAQPWIWSLSEVEASIAGGHGRALLFDAPTPNLLKLNCHLSVLAAGTTPHPPHTHRDEELILPLRGEVEILRGASLDAPGLQTEAAGPGQLVFHASQQPHTIRAAGPGPALYFVLRWEGRADETAGRIPSQIVDLRPDWESLEAAGGTTGKVVVLDQPTALLGKLHVHLTRLEPGAESPEHVDLHDVVMVTVEGEIETLGAKVEPNSVIFHPAHVPHSIRNIGKGPARYLVVEFHSAN